MKYSYVHTVKYNLKESILVSLSKKSQKELVSKVIKIYSEILEEAIKKYLPLSHRFDVTISGKKISFSSENKQDIEKVIQYVRDVGTLLHHELNNFSLNEKPQKIKDNFLVIISQINLAKKLNDELDSKSHMKRKKI